MFRSLMSQKVIIFHYSLSDADGVQIENSNARGEPITFMSGVGMIVPGLEKEIINFEVGDKRRVEVKAEEAYGLIDFGKYVQVPLEALSKPDLKVGDVFQSSAAPTPFIVKELTATHAVLDGNHPLAGDDLVFDVEVVESRDATPEEIEEVRQQIANGPEAPLG
ncbi:MAG: FKBP-type peptidyl-prolyl cis-trans isomerase [Verrucomicrobiota bacterium]